jgi:selenocysteine-specific elongation factor
VAHRQDRFIIRSYSPMTTIGGGQVVDPNPVKHRRFRDEVMAALAELESGEKSFLLQKIAEQGCLRLKELEVVSGLGAERIAGHLQALEGEGKLVRLGDQWTAAETVRSWRRRLGEEAERFHAANPLLPGIPRATLRGALPAALAQKGFDLLLEKLTGDGTLVAEEESVRLPSFRAAPSPEQEREIARIEEAYRQDGALAKNRREMLERLGIDQCRGEDYLAYLFAGGRLVRLNEESFLHVETYRQAVAALISHFAAHQTLTLAEFRDLLGSARKQVQALLEHFDARKYTLRKGDLRVAWKLPVTSDE